MEDLKSFNLYNLRLNKLIKSYQTKNPYSLHSLESTLSKKTQVSKPSEPQNPPASKILYINTQFDESMKETFPLNPNKNHTTSISQVLMNYSPQKQNKNELLPFLKGKKNIQNRHFYSKMNKTQGFQQNNKSKILVEENIGKITTDPHHNFLFTKEKNLIGLHKKPFTTIKISLKYRKNFEKKVEGKFEIFCTQNEQKEVGKASYMNWMLKDWDYK